MVTSIEELVQNRNSTNRRRHEIKFDLLFHSETVEDIFGDKVVVPTSGHAQIFQISVHRLPADNLIPAVSNSCKPQLASYGLQLQIGDPFKAREYRPDTLITVIS